MADIEHIQYINAPAAVVYRALTTEAGLAEVWTRELAVEARLGAVNTFHFGDEKPTRMKIVALVTDARLAWECVDSDPEWIGTEVSFELTESAGKTSIILRHKHWREVTDFTGGATTTGRCFCTA
ncbi:SRPBCC domain-containing protein [Alkalilimnicola ehrlichii]|uniref:SRPBCC family protein n=1 Tax=Alkalilimnicola ehrlichii TaxID=351052 RepID=UPI001C6DE1BD|nr:SRPBCC domain-containing protein [Alkalilimnicola ehrlichii]